MTEQQFVYWLQGFAELTPNPPTAEQWQSIREHLATVFRKVTPAVGPMAKPAMDHDKEGALKRFFEKNQQDRVAPVPSMPNWPPYQPYHLGKPGDLIC